MRHEFCSGRVFGFCLLLSCVFAGMEAGVVALSRLRIRRRIRAGDRSAAVLQDYLYHPESFLWTILVGNTVANFLILGWAFVQLYRLLGHYGRIGFVLAYLVVVLLFYAFFDFLPKMLFRSYPTRLCILLARPFRVVHLLLIPLALLVERVSDLLLRWHGGKVFTGHLFGNREELRLLMQESAATFTSEERLMISRVMDLQSLTVRQVMSPLRQAVTVESTATISEALAVFRDRKLTRLPVWDTRGGQRRIAGLLNLDLLLYQAQLDPLKPVAEQLKPALYLEEDLRLELALRRMQRSGHRLAIVLARDQREIGVLSLQDVLKLMFGEVTL